MKENKFDTVKKAGNKNSIEEDIKIVENYLAHSAINETDSDFFKNGGWEIVDLEILKSMQHILSAYKKILRENEKLKNQEETARKVNELLVERYSTSIPVQKVKNKIEEIDKEKLGFSENE